MILSKVKSHSVRHGKDLLLLGRRGRFRGSGHGDACLLRRASLESKALPCCSNAAKRVKAAPLLPPVALRRCRRLN